MIFSPVQPQPLLSRPLHLSLSLAKSSLLSWVIALPLSPSFVFLPTSFSLFLSRHGLHRSSLNLSHFCLLLFALSLIPSFLSLFPLSRFRTISLDSSGVHLLSQSLSPYILSLNSRLPFVLTTGVPSFPSVQIYLQLSQFIPFFILSFSPSPAQSPSRLLSLPSLSILLVSTSYFFATAHLLFLISCVFSPSLHFPKSYSSSPFRSLYSSPIA